MIWSPREIIQAGLKPEICGLRGYIWGPSGLRGNQRMEEWPYRTSLVYYRLLFLLGLLTKKRKRFIEQHHFHNMTKDRSKELMYVDIHILRLSLLSTIQLLSELTFRNLNQSLLASFLRKNPEFGSAILTRIVLYQDFVFACSQQLIFLFPSPDFVYDSSGNS